MQDFLHLEKAKESFKKMDWTGEPKEVKMDLSNKRITVTGGKGFLGTHLIRKLKEERKCQNVFIADLPEYDLIKHGVPN